MFAITNPVIDPSIGTAVVATDPQTPLVTYLINFIRIGFIVGIVLMLFMLIVGAIEYITAGGEKDKVGSASKRITTALTGLAILFSVFAISWLVSAVFGIDVLKLVIPTITP